MPNRSTFHRGIFSQSPYFPLTTWCGSPIYRHLSKDFPIRPARARRGLPAEARTPFSELGLRSSAGLPGLGEGCPARPAQHRRGVCGLQARPRQRGTREVISSPPPLFPARHGLGTRWRVQFPETSPRVSPRASPGLSPRPGRLCKPPSREGNAPRAPRRGLAPTPPGRAAGLVGTHRGLHGGAGCAGGRRAAGRAPVRGAGPAAAASFALRPLHPSATRRWAEQGRGGGAGPRSAGTMTRGAGRSLSRLPGPHPAGGTSPSVGGRGGPGSTPACHGGDFRSLWDMECDWPACSWK